MCCAMQALLPLLRAIYSGGGPPALRARTATVAAALLGRVATLCDDARALGALSKGVHAHAMGRPSALPCSDLPVHGMLCLGRRAEHVGCGAVGVTRLARAGGSGCGPPPPSRDLAAAAAAADRVLPQARLTVRVGVTVRVRANSAADLVLLQGARRPGGPPARARRTARRRARCAVESACNRVLGEATSQHATIGHVAKHSMRRPSVAGCHEAQLLLSPEDAEAAEAEEAAVAADDDAFGDAGGGVTAALFDNFGAIAASSRHYKALLPVLPELIHATVGLMQIHPASQAAWERELDAYLQASSAAASPSPRHHPPSSHPIASRHPPTLSWCRTRMTTRSPSRREWRRSSCSTSCWTRLARRRRREEDCSALTASRCSATFRAAHARVSCPC